MRLAEALLDTRFRGADGLLRLRRWRDEFYAWTSTHYCPVTPDELRGLAWAFLDGVMVPGTNEPTKYKPTSRRVSEMLDALLGVSGVLVTADATPAIWLDGISAPSAGPILPCRNGLLDLDTRTLHKHTPAYFQTYAVPFDYGTNAPKPTAWTKFLADLWAGDYECIALLQEWFGYILSGDTSHQKILLLIGPKRSGKGTIARVLAALLGRENVVSPTLASLGEQFGVQPLIGRNLAIVSDARLSGRSDLAIVIERLLSISGEDLQTVSRKHLPVWTGRLPTRFTILTNEAPRLTDVSGALASRFLVLPTKNSFYGNEDRTLFDRIELELPGVLLWALDGLDRLRGNGKFTIPESAADMTETLGDLSSPIQVFIRDCCIIDAAASVETRTLFSGWRHWCEENGRDHVGTIQTFGRDLIAVAPGIRIRQLRQGDGTRYRAYEGIELQ